MIMKSQRKIYLYFGMAFLVFAVITVVVQVNRERRHQTDELKAQLHAYALMTNGFLNYFHDTLAVADMLPDSLRFTLINGKGEVVFDNVADKRATSVNHYDRPEIVAARLYGNGYAIRKSESVNRDYLYYAYRCPTDSYIRLALPYHIDIRDVIGREALMMYLLSLSLIVVLIILLAKSGQLRESRKQILSEKKRNRQMKQEMTNNIAHELKTPVASIRGYLESLSDNPDLDAEKRRHFIDRAYVQTLRLTDLINDISLITKLEESSQLFAKEKVNLHHIMDEVINEFDSLIQESGDVVKNDFPEQSDFMGNGILVFSIFRNLVENALHYAGQGVEIVAMLDEQQDRDAYHVVFYDTGRGVPEKDLERIFDRFVRLDDGRDRRNGGTGLGLAIVKHAVQFHGGSITAENREDGGLRFRFDLKK